MVVVTLKCIPDAPVPWLSCQGASLVLRLVDLGFPPPPRPCPPFCPVHLCRWGSGSTPLSSLPTATPSFSLESTLTTPFPAPGVAATTLRAHQTTANHAAASSYTLVSRGLSLSADTISAGTFTAATTVRTLTDLSPVASLSVREEAGTSTLTALTHTIDTDTRDSAVGPTTGWRAGLTTTLAGVLRRLGDVRHARVEADAQGHVPVGASGITASLAVRAGAAVPWGGDPAVRLADRFYLGGPASLRGFAVRGVGPVDGHDALGGDLYYAATAMLTGPSPRGGGGAPPARRGGRGWRRRCRCGRTCLSPPGMWAMWAPSGAPSVPVGRAVAATATAFVAWRRGWWRAPAWR